MKVYCHNCQLFVAEIVTGSNIRKGAVMLCSGCIKLLEDATKGNPTGKDNISNPFGDIFGDIFKGKK